MIVWLNSTHQHNHKRTKNGCKNNNDNDNDIGDKNENMAILLAIKVTIDSQHSTFKMRDKNFMQYRD